MTEKSYQDAVQVLKNRIGGRWDGLEQDGRDDMVQILEHELGYNHRQANDTINAMIQSGQLRYHRAGPRANEPGGGTAAIGDAMPLPAVLPIAGGAGLGGSSGGMGGVPIAPVVGLQGGYWQIGAGEGEDMPPGRGGQVTPS